MEGNDVTLAAMGVMVSVALDAAEILSQQGIQARVLDVHTIKPLDGEAIVAAARSTHLIVTLEDHNVIGGLGSAVAEYLSGSLPQSRAPHRGAGCLHRVQAIRPYCSRNTVWMPLRGSQGDGSACEN